MYALALLSLPALARSTSPAARAYVPPASNNPPTGTAVTASTNEDTAVNVTLTATDPDGDTLTYSIVTPPAHGAYSLSGSTVRYTPDTDWSGTETFVWSCSDGRGGNCRNTNATVTVASVNDAPVITSTSGSGTEDADLTMSLTGTDAEGEALTWTVATAPAHGSASISRGTLRFTPDTDWYGTDTMRVTATDTSGGATTGTLTLTVTNVNDRPVAVDQSVSVENDVTTAITVSATDADGDAITYSVGSPRNGTATISGSVVSYTPDRGFSGSDAFNFTASDGTVSDTGTVSVTVVTTNTAPVATATTQSGYEDTALTFTLSATDAEGDAMTYTVSTSPTNGTILSLVGNQLTYMPDADWNGTDTFTWFANDGRSDSNVARTTLQVQAVNDAPVGTSASTSVPEDGSIGLRLSSSDIDTTSGFTYTITREPDHGRLVGSSTTYGYYPHPDWNGTDSFEFTVSDGTDTSAPATVTIEVTPVDDVPRAYATVANTPINEPVQFEATWVDPDTDATLGIVLTSRPTYGALRRTRTGFRYTPHMGFFGTDRFNWYVTDGVTSSDVVEAKIVVHPETFLGRPDLLQFGLNKIQYGLGGTASDYSDAIETFTFTTVQENLELLGAQIIRQLARADLTWSTIELSPGNFQQPETNQVLRQGIVEPTVTLFEQQYASPTPPYCEEGEPFQRYMGDEAFTYLDRVLTGYAHQVNSYELGNEMYHWVAVTEGGGGSNQSSELPDCLPEDGYAPAEQGIFMEEAARTLKEGDPEAVITLSSIATESNSAEDWLIDVVGAAGDTDWFDVIAYHSYEGWQRAFYTRDNLESLMIDLGLQDKLVRVTEAGSSSDADYTDRTDYPNSDETQCADIFRLPLISWGYGDASFIWHTYAPVTETGGDFQGFEIIEYDGTWKPAAYSYQLLTQNLLPFRQITNMTQDTLYVYQIVNTFDETRWVAWGEDQEYEVPEGVTEYTSVYPEAGGSFAWTSVEPGDRLELTDTPILLR